MDRRDVLALLAAAGAGAAIGGPWMKAAEASGPITRPVPKSGETIPVE